MNITQQLSDMLEQKKYNEARILIQQIISEPLSDIEKKGILVDTLTSILEVQTSVNNIYDKNLEAFIKTLKDLNKRENMLDKLQLEINTKREEFRKN